MNKLLLFLVLCSIAPYAAFSQYEFQNQSKNEYVFGIGPSQFLGDLGGSSGVGTHFLKDFNSGSIRYGGVIGYRHRISKTWFLRPSLTIGELYGNDNLSSNAFRFDRNQNFRTLIIEPSVQMEYHFYQYDQQGHRYKIKHAHGARTLKIDGYVFAGFGLFYFNPQGQYSNGQWYSLRPLSTEGEGLPGGPPTYSPIALCFPAGFGFKYYIDNQWSVGIEGSTRIWTSTDYIDDTHGKYFNPEEIEKYKGPVAAYFSGPVLGLIPGQNAIGQERGDPNNNDTYMFLFFTLNYRLNPYAHRRNHSKF
jgi:hypothetical protein